MHVASTSFGLGLFDAAALIGVIAAIVTGVVAVRKLGPEKDAIYISSVQGAAVIQTNLIATLQAEVERERAHSRECEIEVERLEAEVERLQAANLVLRSRSGERHDDRDPSAPE